MIHGRSGNGIFSKNEIKAIEKKTKNQNEIKDNKIWSMPESTLTSHN